MTVTKRISKGGGREKGEAFLQAGGRHGEESRVSIGKSLTIGSQEECGLTLSDPTVSRRHAEVLRTPDGYLLRDLGSTNGTFLNDVRVDSAYLRDGAVLRMGKTELVFKWALPPSSGRTPGPPFSGKWLR